MTPKYLYEETSSRREPLRQRGGREDRQEDLKEMNMYVFRFSGIDTVEPLITDPPTVPADNLPIKDTSRGTD